MADINIDTSNPTYQTWVTRWDDLMTYIGPKIQLYYRMSDAQQIAWRQRDPLMDKMLRFVDRVQLEKDDIN